MDLLTWLFDLPASGANGADTVLLRWQNPYARWILLAAGCVIVAALITAWRHQHSTTLRRMSLASLRSGVLLLIAVMLCEPVLVYQRDRIEPADVHLLVDTSESMSTREPYPDKQLAAAVVSASGCNDANELEELSRFDLVQHVLLRDEAAVLRTLARNNRVVLATFDSGVQQRATCERSRLPDEIVEALSSQSATGAATRLTPALEQVMHRKSGANEAAVIVLSDGVLTPGDRMADAIALAVSEDVPVYVVPVGSPHHRRDVAVQSARASGSFVTGDMIAVHVELAGYGLDQPTPVTVNLINRDDQTILESQRIDLKAERGQADIELVFTPDHAGAWRLQVAVVPVEGETDLDNNAAGVDVTVRDAIHRVLYVEGYPRFEYRYLKNALLRESSVQLSCLLLSADRGFAQEGADSILRFSETPDELHRFDAVIFGDVDLSAAWIGEAQLRMLADFVSQGGGFGFIAGQRHTLAQFVGTPLEALIPVRLDPSMSSNSGRTFGAPRSVRPSSAGEVSALFRFHASPEQSSRIIESLPGIYWSMTGVAPAPAAETLLEIDPADAGDACPVVVTGRYGAGPTFCQLTDDTWRWRRLDGELLHDAYWVQVVRYLAGGNATAQPPATLVAAPGCVRAGEPVQITLTVHDGKLDSRLDDQLDVIVMGPDDEPLHNVELRRIDPASARFEGSFRPQRSGALHATVMPPQTADLPDGLTARLRVDPADAERAVLHADYDALARLASATGGSVIPLDQLASMFGAIEDRSTRIPNDIIAPLWSTKAPVVAFAVLLAAEWILRKRYGLP